MARLGKRQRERLHRQRSAEVDRDAGMLPADGPIADLVERIGAELDQCIVQHRSSGDYLPILHPLGVEAFGLVGSIRGMRAVRQKASNRGVGQPEVRLRMLNDAWAGIGDDRGTQVFGEEC